MDINEIKSNLQMNNFYFSSCKVQRDAKVVSGEYNANLERNIEKIQEHLYSVQVKVVIQKEDFAVEVVANAEFVFEGEDHRLEDSLIKTNTVAIMFPFIRSQVTLLTTQPGMAPIVLPPINTTKLV